MSEDKSLDHLVAEVTEARAEEMRQAAILKERDAALKAQNEVWDAANKRLNEAKDVLTKFLETTTTREARTQVEKETDT